MKRTVSKIEESRFEVLVDVDSKVWVESQTKALEKLAKNVEVPGFRKGKVPVDMAKKHIDQGKIFNEAINLLLPATFTEVIKEEKLQPFANPGVEITKLSDTELQVKFVILTAPVVTLGKYKGLHVDKKEIVVSDEEVKAALKEHQNQSAELVSKEGAAEIGDTVVIDFEGFVDGKAFEGGKAENYSLELGSHSFVPGFEEQLVGLKAEDAKDILVTFPKEYVKDLAGKEATFKVKVHEVKAKKIPELDDELVKELEIKDVNTVKDLENYDRIQLLNKKEEEAKKEYWASLIKLIRDEAKIEVAQEIIHSEVEAMKENISKQAAQSGLTIEQYLQIVGQTNEEFEKKLAEEALINIRTVLILEKIAEVEGIKVSQEDIDFEIAKIADQYKMEFDKVKEILTKDMDRFTADIRSRRIEEFLLKNND